MTEHRFNWKDVIALLNGSDKAGGIAARIISQETDTADLPDLFHALITESLLHAEWMTRVNAAYTLQLLAAKHRIVLVKDISVSCSDGELLTLDELDMDKVLRSDYVQLHRGIPDTSNQCPSTAHTRMYSKQWLKSQRNQLVKRLGFDCADDLTRTAYQFDRTAKLLSAEDVSKPLSSSSSSSFSAGQHSKTTSSEDDRLTSECWIVRLMRFMIVGLFDNRWETRHGCSLGLMRLLAGLRTCSKNTPEEALHLVNSGEGDASDLLNVSLPRFLVEDIVCSSICVLLFDKFLDISNDGTVVISPVKEALSQLIACGTINFSCFEGGVVQQDRIVKHLLRISSMTTEDWSVRICGLLALKYVLLAVHQDVLFANMDQVLVEICNGLQEAIFDMNIAACRALKALRKAVELIDSDHARCISLILLMQVIAALHNACDNITTVDAHAEVLLEALCDAVHLVCSSASQDSELQPRMICTVGLQVLNNSLFPNLMRSSSDILSSFNFTSFGSRLCELIKNFAKLANDNQTNKDIDLNDSHDIVAHLLSCSLIISNFTRLWISWRADQASRPSESPPTDGNPVDRDSEDLQLRSWLTSLGAHIGNLIADVYCTLPLHDGVKFMDSLTSVVFDRACKYVATSHWTVESIKKALFNDPGLHVTQDSSMDCIGATTSSIMHDSTYLDRLNNVADQNNNVPNQTQDDSQRIGSKRLRSDDENESCSATTAAPNDEKQEVLPRRSERLAAKKPAWTRTFNMKEILAYGEAVRPYKKFIDPRRVESVQPLALICLNELVKAANSRISIIDSNKITLQNQGTQSVAEFEMQRLSNIFQQLLNDLTPATANLLQAIAANSSASASTSSSQAPLRKKLTIVIKGLSSTSVRFEREVCLPATNDHARRDDSSKSSLSLEYQAVVQREAEMKQKIYESLVQAIRISQSMVLCLLLATNRLNDCRPACRKYFESVSSIWKSLATQFPRDLLSLSSRSNYNLLIEEMIPDISLLLENLTTNFPRMSLTDDLNMIVAIKNETIRSEMAIQLSSQLMSDPLARPQELLTILDRDIGPALNNAKRAVLLCTLLTAPPHFVAEFIIFCRVLSENNAILGLELIASCLPILPAGVFDQLVSSNILANSLVNAALDNKKGDINDSSEPNFRSIIAMLTQMPAMSNSVSVVISQLRAALHSFLHSNDVQTRIDGSKRSAAASLIVLIVTAVKDNPLITVNYREWISLVLSLIGDHDRAVRKCCMSVFRMLVPYAQLLQQPSSVVSTGSCSTSAADDAIIDRILSRSEPPDIVTNPIYSEVVVYLRQHTPLMQDQLQQDGHHHPFSLALRPYQWIGVSWISHLWQCGLGGLLADDMGLGKTIQALTALAVHRIRSNFQTASSILICPASLRLHWFREISKFFQGELLTPVYFTSPTAAAHLPDYKPSNVVIISYEAYRQAADKVNAIFWEVALIDEAHNLRNPHTQVAKAVFQLKSRLRLALTGTPIQNQAQDLWSLMNFVMPDFLGDFKAFKEAVIQPIAKSIEERSNSQHDISTNRKLFLKAADVSSEGLRILHELHKQVMPFILRRTKSSVALELPPKEIIDVFCPLSPVQRQLYASFQKGLSISDDELERNLTTRSPQGPAVPTNSSVGTTANHVHPFAALKYLQLLCVHPSLVISAEHRHYKNRLLNEFNASGKMLQLARLLLESKVLSDSDGVNIDQMYNDDVMANVGNDSDYESEPSMMADGDPWYRAEDESSSDCSDVDEDEDEVDSGEDLQQGQDTGAGTATYQHMNSASITAAIHRKQLLETIRPSDVQPTARTQSVSPSASVQPGSPTRRGSIAIGATRDAVVGEPHPCLIFAQHQSTLDLIETCVMKRYFPTVRYAKLDGRMPSQQRAEIIEAFNDRHNCVDLENQHAQFRSRLPRAAYVDVEGLDEHNDSDGPPQILLMTTRSCGVGVNLTAADTVIFLEHDWNPFVDLQAMDRAHRIGQRKSVTVYRLLAESTIEARINFLQDIKKFLSNEILQGNQDGDRKPTAMEAARPSLGVALWQSIQASTQNSAGTDVLGVAYTPDEYEVFDADTFLKTIR